MCIVCQQLSEFESRLKIVEEKQTEVTTLVNQILRNNPSKKTYSVKEAAVLLGKSAYTISEWCRDGKLTASRSGTEGMWFISAETIVSFTSKQLSHG